MKFFHVIGLWLLAGAVQADCAGRVNSASREIEHLYGERLSAGDERALIDILQGLCHERVPGSSVTTEPGRRIISTVGMKPPSKAESQSAGDVVGEVIVLEVEADNFRRRQNPRTQK